MDAVKFLCKVATMTLAGGVLMGLVVLAFAGLANNDADIFHIVKGSAIGAAIFFVEAIR